MTKLNSVLSEIVEHVFTSCRVAVAPRSGKCLDLNAMNFSKFFLFVFCCSWLSILLMLAYMGTVIVILFNILIAQMSTTYIQAKKVARVEYDVDRILQLTRMERFPFLVCFCKV